MPIEKPLTGPSSPLYRKYHAAVLNIVEKLTNLKFAEINQNSTWTDPFKALLRYTLPHEFRDRLLEDNSPLLHVCMATFLTSTLFIGIILAIFIFPQSWQFGFAVASLSFFHLMEYVMLAIPKTNFESLSYTSFAVFLKPMLGYHVILYEYLFWVLLSWANGWQQSQPYWGNRIVSWCGVVLVIIGQFYRSLAMFQAGYNFQYTLREKRDERNHLVTTGLYSAVRHPSYFGMAIYTIGYILLLNTPLIAILYVIINSPLMVARIELEEEKLVDMYGEEYHRFRSTTPAIIPNANIFKLSSYWK
jgi:protein-S-isoprenylcysteine O-methyltransferase